MILCQTQIALTYMVLWFCLVIIVLVTITKFMFICVWKSMRTMNDDLMVRIAINQALLSSMVIGMLLKFRIQVNCIFMLKVTEHSYFYQRYTYRVLKTIQMKIILLCVWAEPAIFGSAKTALKFNYEI